MSDSPVVSVIIVNYNGRHHLTRCLPALRAQVYPNIEVIVIDNGSTDGSAQYVREHFPEMRIVESGANLGYAAGNNFGFQLASGDYFAVLNPDTEPQPDWLSQLVTDLSQHRDAGLATSKILLMDRPSVINTCGNQVSVTGLAFCRGAGRHASCFTEPTCVPAVSGAAFLVRRSVIEEIGGFDPEFFTYLEDTDLSLRALLAGYTCRFVPSSIVLHQYRFSLGEVKAFHLEKNRYAMLLTILHRRTLFFLIPVLAAAEVLVWGYMVTRGPRFMYQKFRSYVWLFRNRSRIRANRERIQQTRTVSDRVVLGALTPSLAFDQTTSAPIARALEKLTTPLLSTLSMLPLRYATPNSSIENPS